MRQSSAKVGPSIALATSVGLLLPLILISYFEPSNQTPCHLPKFSAGGSAERPFIALLDGKGPSATLIG